MTKRYFHSLGKVSTATRGFVFGWYWEDAPWPFEFNVAPPPPEP